MERMHIGWAESVLQCQYSECCTAKLFKTSEDFSFFCTHINL